MTDQSPSTMSIARNILMSSDGDMDRATEALMRRARSSKDLMAELLRLGCRHQLGVVARYDRDAAYAADPAPPYTPTEGAKASQRRLARVGMFMSDLLLDMPIIIGGVVKSLRAWSGTEIVAYAEGEMARAKTSMRNAMFLRSVGQAAGNGIIGEVMDEGRLRDLRARADAAV